MIENAYHLLYVSALVILSIVTFACLVKAIAGPRIADRVVAINMICTLTLCMIGILAAMLGGGEMPDAILAAGGELVVLLGLNGVLCGGEMEGTAVTILALAGGCGAALLLRMLAYTSRYEVPEHDMTWQAKLDSLHEQGFTNEVLEQKTEDLGSVQSIQDIAKEELGLVDPNTVIIDPE